MDTIRKIIGILGFILFLTGLSAQRIDFSQTLDWRAPQKEFRGEDNQLEYIYFNGAMLIQTPNPTPFFYKAIPIASQHSALNLRLTNLQWQNMTADEIRLINTELIADTIQTDFTIGQTRKQAEVYLRFFPFRKQGGTFQKLTAFTLQGDVVSVLAKTRKLNIYAPSSVLGTGDFYKMAISKTGIYKITYNNLKEMNVNLSSLSFGNIALFGNGGRRLPENTSTPILDDLQEVPISIVDHNGNGLFDADDYILFYGVGIIAWTPKNIHTKCQFEHDMNFYTHHAYYFLTTTPGVGVKKRISSMPSVATAPTHTVSTYYYRDVIERELENIRKVSRIWVGENMAVNNPVEYRFIAPGISKNETIYLRFSTAVTKPSSFSVSLSGNANTFAAGHSADNSFRVHAYDLFKPSTDELAFSIKYSTSSAGAIGWVDYLEVHGRADLGQYAGAISFRNPEIVGAGNIAEYRFNTNGKNTTVWDVTNPHDVRKVNGSINGNTLAFRLPADTLREFAAFDGTSFLSVSPIGKIANQNLHSLGYADFIIITHPDFKQQAERLANFRRQNDGMTVHLVTTEQVYNEFGSGIADASAIRNFLKMFYDRASAPSDVPQNCLLFGKASIDFRKVYTSTTCFIPLFLGSNLFAHDDDLATDNFFGKLADGKGDHSYGTMDMGIGRLSAQTNNTAAVLVEKSIRYAAMNNLASQNEGKISNVADWRNVLTMVADDDANPNPRETHLLNAEAVLSRSGVDSLHYINIDKIYCDAYRKVNSSQGDRYPEATAALNRRVNNGSLILTYFGHGGDGGWSQERLLLRSDIQKWNNKYALPFFFAGCCTFNRYDRLEGTSPSEDALFKADGGAIGLIASTRNTFSTQNENIASQIVRYAFEKQPSGRYLTWGEVHASSQAQVPTDVQVLMGDPSVTPAHPRLNVVTDTINGISALISTDTIKSLKRITVSGHIEDASGNPAANFNGWIYPSLFDKIDSITTFLNNGASGFLKTFALQKNVIFKGKVRVNDGRFSFSFIAPKDMNVDYGQGKISYYATNHSDRDAKGFTNIIVGGIYDTVINDDLGPDIELWLNDEKFVNGGITTPTPVLLARISDSSGVNTSAVGVGHEILATIDNDMNNAIVLNDFFEYDSNSSASGRISYALSTLAPGRHTLTLRAWDIVNNMGEKTIDFEVVENADFQLRHVLNYPNPFTTNTQFFFEHNRPNMALTASVQIFTISGKVVRTIISKQSSLGFRSDPIPWDGKDDFGDKLARGVYIYKLKVTALDGSHAEKIEKIVIL